MKPLSESLEDLATRVKVIEDSATATFEADRARLEKRRHEIDEAFETEAGKFEVAAYFLNVAEYAVIDAALARMAADDLAGAAATTGATS